MALSELPWEQFTHQEMKSKGRTTAGQCHQAALKGILILQRQTLSTGPLTSLKVFLPPGPQKVCLTSTCALGCYILVI